MLFPHWGRGLSAKNSPQFVVGLVLTGDFTFSDSFSLEKSQSFFIKNMVVINEMANAVASLAMAIVCHLTPSPLMPGYWSFNAEQGFCA